MRIAAETAIFEQRGPIAIVTLNRPERANSFNNQMHLDVCGFWDRINGDPAIRVAILTGAGDRAFCAGGDLKEYLDHYGQPDRLVRSVDDPASADFGKRFNHYPVEKPLIAALNGYAVGGGIEVALLADLRVMADDTYIADLHAKANVFGAAGLASELPWAIANELSMANGRLSAQRCLHFGFVNRVVPRAQLMDSALDLAEMVLSSGPDSLRHLKAGAIARQVASGNVTPPGTERAHFSRLRATIDGYDSKPNALEGIRAVVERRAAEYRGSDPSR